jgi:hypothetical protein
VALHEIVGNVGVVAILVAYALLQLGRLDGRGWRYAALNAVGAALILYSLTHAFNQSAFLIESAWLVISLFGIGRVAWERRRGLPK